MMGEVKCATYVVTSTVSRNLIRAVSSVAEAARHLPWSVASRKTIVSHSLSCYGRDKRAR